MRHVERHIVKENNPIWQQIDSLCFLSKNLYNYANYQVRQSFIFEKVYQGFNQVYHQVKNSADYRALPAKVSQQVLRTLGRVLKVGEMLENTRLTYLALSYDSSSFSTR